MTSPESALGEQVILDDFFNGRPLEICLLRYAHEIEEAGGLTLEILPYSTNAPIFMPSVPTQEVLLELKDVQLLSRYAVRGLQLPHQNGAH